MRKETEILMDAALRIAKSSPKKVADVPVIQDWMRQWGQSPNSDNHHGYKHTTKHGEYHIMPALDRVGKQIGFHLQFAHTGEGKKEQPGMWHDLGLFTHPGLAVAGARKHHNCFKSKNESVEKKKTKLGESTISKIAKILLARKTK